MIERALKLAREFNRLKQVELAERLGVSPSFLSEIESGKKTVTVDLLERYSKALNLPASTLMVLAERLDGSGTSLQQKRARKLIEWLELMNEDDETEATP